MASIFDHRLNELMAMDPEEFSTPTVDEVMERITSWDLPEEYQIVLRVYNKKTGKLKERAYKTHRNATKALEKINPDENEIAFFDNEGMHSNYSQTSE